ncbi:MAG: hypothetical protein QM808_03565 [Steroidobacteraceae bacterium]
MASLKSGLLLTVCTGSLLTNIWLYKQLNETRAANQSAPIPTETQKALFNPTITSSTPLVIPTGSSTCSTGSSSLSSTATIAANVAPSSSNSTATNSITANLRERLKDPAQQEAYKKNMISGLKMSMSDLGSVLGLDEPSVDQLLELMANQSIAMLTNPSPGSTQTTLKAAIAAEFGETVADGFIKYQREASSRRALSETAGNMALANVEFSASQRQKFFDSYLSATEATNPRPNASSASSSGNIDALTAMQTSLTRLEATQQRVLSDAASYLNTAQMQILQKKFQSDIDKQKQMMEMIRNRSGSISQIN